jgi:hypothetical protein
MLYIYNTYTFTNFEGKTFNVKKIILIVQRQMWFTLYFVNIVTNLFTSEKPGTPCTKDIC